jgi:formylglycine-generating enzyme required for sulfatase activity
VEHHPETGLPQRILSEIDGVEMLYVPPGEFTLGLEPDLDSVAQAAAPHHKLQDAGPARQITMHGFYIDLKPCPVHAFRRFLQRGGYANAAYWSQVGWAAHHGPARPDRLAWEQWVHKESRRLPAESAVAHVSWYEATACSRWSQKRLPTEAEWERAVLYWSSQKLGVTQAEWCADTWQPHGDLEAISAPFVDGEERAAKVLRGTILSFHGDLITAKIRSDADPEERFWTVGFRTVWVP